VADLSAGKPDISADKPAPTARGGPPRPRPVPGSR